MMVTVHAYSNSLMDVPVFSVNCSESMSLQVMERLHEKFGYTFFRIR